MITITELDIAEDIFDELEPLDKRSKPIMQLMDGTKVRAIDWQDGCTCNCPNCEDRLYITLSYKGAESTYYNGENMMDITKDDFI